MYYERAIEKTIENINDTFPVLLLTGTRQVGKTTLLERMAGSSRKRVSLDNPTLRALAKSDPELFLQRYTPPVLIDEVQYAPELFPYIKMIVDQRKRPGDFWLTGSQSFKMRKDAAESLAGRVGIVPMLGLSNSEIHGTDSREFTLDPGHLIKRVTRTPSMNVQEIFQQIYQGSMPRLYEIDNVNRELFFESYLDTYISREKTAAVLLSGQQ